MKIAIYLHSLFVFSIFFRNFVANIIIMALINIREVYPGVHLGLWQMDESVNGLLHSFPWMKRYLPELEKRFKSEVRQKEFLVARALLHEILVVMGISLQQMKGIGEIEHDKNGKPLLKGFRISISHTQGFVAVILSKEKVVGVDIEFYSDRVKKIASKFLRKDEKAKDLDSLLVHWCGKETVYKLFSEENLKFSEMRVMPFDTMSDWACEVKNLKSGKSVNVDFELTMEFVLTYACM